MNASDLSLVSSNTIAFTKPSAQGVSETTDKAASKDSQATTTSDTEGADKSKDQVQLSDKAKALVRSLQARDQQVRAHE